MNASSERKQILRDLRAVVLEFLDGLEAEEKSTELNVFQRRMECITEFRKRGGRFRYESRGDYERLKQKKFLRHMWRLVHRGVQMDDLHPNQRGWVNDNYMEAARGLEQMNQGYDD